jgi:hypothetical protein
VARPVGGGQRVSFSASRALGTSMRNIRADERWLLKVVLGGALTTSVLGLPLAQGFVIESLENIQRGYPTPLPPWGQWGARLLDGLMALLVDFTYFVLPLLGALLLFFCGTALHFISYAQARTIRFDLGLIILVLLAIPFALGASPLGRLALLGGDEASAQRAPVRTALRGPGRPLYLRARLATLPAYLPALLAVGLLWVARQLALPAPLQLLAAWLLGSAIFLAHLVVVQVYALAARALQQLEFEARLRERQGS